MGGEISCPTLSGSLRFARSPTLVLSLSTYLQQAKLLSYSMVSTKSVKNTDNAPG